MLIEKLMASIGVGTATLSLTLQKTSFFHGNMLEGTLLLTGGAVEQHIEQLLVRLSEHHAAGKDSYWKTLCEVVAAKAVHIAPHQTQEFTFQLPVPDAAEITNSDLMTSSTRVVAEADVLWAVNPLATFDVQITPDPEILVLDAAMSALGFTATRELFSEPMNKTLKAVQKTYIAPSSLSDRISGATLQVHNGEGKLSGRLVLNHRENHLADYIRAVVNGDKERLPLELPSEHVLGEQGLALATAHLKLMLNQALGEADSKP